MLSPDGRLSYPEERPLLSKILSDYAQHRGHLDSDASGKMTSDSQKALLCASSNWAYQWGSNSGRWLLYLYWLDALISGDDVSASSAEALGSDLARCNPLNPYFDIHKVLGLPGTLPGVFASQARLAEELQEALALDKAKCLQIIRDFASQQFEKESKLLRRASVKR